jgi:hypothetical protein
LGRTIECDSRVGAAEYFSVERHEVLVVEDFRVGAAVGEVFGKVSEFERVGRLEAGVQVIE